MNLMTVKELIDLFVKDGITNAGQAESGIMLQLDSCNSESDFNMQYAMLGELTGMVRAYMAMAGNEGKHWPADLLDNVHGYVTGKMGENQVNVPKKIHFVWVGGAITQTVMDYVNVWAAVSPSYEINIWYDSNLLCLKKLSDLFGQMAEERYSKEEDRNNWADAVFRLRQQFTAFVLTRHPDFGNMTQAMNEFLASIEENIVLQDDGIWTGPAIPGNMRILDMHAEGILEHELYTAYMKEAVQTQNFAALSDIARLLVLKKHGGVYLDADMLPQINPELINEFDAYDIDIQRPLIQAVMRVAGYIPNYSAAELKECEMGDRMIQAVRNLLPRGPVLLELGDISCHPKAYRVFYNDRGIINQMVAAHPESMMINMLLTQIGRNYDTMENNFGEPPFTERSLPDVTDERARIWSRIPEGRAADFLERCVGYYKTGLIKDYRSTLAITGPTIYSSVIFDATKFESGPCSQTKNKVDTKSVEYQCFGIPFHKLTVYTEEELRSSWAVR
ncbi:MAG: hypothetical protein HFH14_01145 [Lachnospiraceae bacterium]|nr:hypothetical protein [Lachnospiraceae bacterium]